MTAVRHHKALALFVGMLILLAATRAAAQDAGPDAGAPDAGLTELQVGPDEALQFERGPRCTVGPILLNLAPGRYLPEPTWGKLDTEVKRLQDAETRLGAENGSLRKSLAESGPGWGTVGLALGTLLAGILAGAVAY